MKPIDKYEFPDCMHALAAAMHMQNIDPGTVVITIPRDKWWQLWSQFDSKYGFLMTHDGRATVPDQFVYMGFRFCPK